MLYHSARSKTHLRITAVVLPLVVSLIFAGVILLFGSSLFSIIVGLVSFVFFLSFSILLWFKAAETFLTIDESQICWKSILVKPEEQVVAISDIAKAELRRNKYDNDVDLPDVVLTLHTGEKLNVPIPDRKPHTVYKVLQECCPDVRFSES